MGRVGSVCFPLDGGCSADWKVRACGGLALAGPQVAPKAALSLHSSAGQGRENTTKGSWVKIRAGGGHSAVTVMGKTDSAWGK